MGSGYKFSDSFIATHVATSDIVAAFDQKLNYLFVNEAACRALKQQPESLLGYSIIDLYPHIIASRNHRNLLRALSGAYIRDVIDGNFETIYTPFIEKNRVACVVARAKRAGT